MKTTVNKTYKFKLDPTEDQKETFRQFAGTRRWLWNYCLEERNKTYEHTGESPSAYDQIGRITKLKNNHEDYEWLKDTQSQVIQQAILDLDQAFKNFFDGSHDYPTFKSKKDTKQTFRFPRPPKIEDSRIRLSRIGWVKYFKDREVVGEAKSVTVKRQANGWFVAINTEQEIEVEWKDEIDRDEVVGIDLGLKHFAITSNGKKIDAPQYLRELEDKLKREQRKLSRKEFGSNNWKKQKEIVAKIHAKIRNKREDFLHKLSAKIVSENQAVVVEDLNVEGMRQNRYLAKSISDASWSNFVRMLKYKCRWSGTYFVQIGRFEPSSKTCRHCGVVNDIDLSDRTFSCSGCGEELDRDVNAAKNVEQFGIDILVGRADRQSNKASGESTSDHANCGLIEVDLPNEEPRGVVKAA